ncbi:MAG: hypothetical protein Q9190_006053 [Brigantiaea leucoxantha]
MDPTKVQPEKNADYDEKGGVGSGSSDDALDFEQGHTQSLSRSLQGRHMQMIAIGGSIGAGLFVGSGSALHNGGPASLVCHSRTVSRKEQQRWSFEMARSVLANSEN